MIKTETVFILGAGASAHLDYPVGTKLKQDIISSIRSHPPTKQSLQSIFRDHPNHKDFMNEFILSSVPSIDAFLEHHNNFQDLGKAMIAYELSKYENMIVLHSAQRNWYAKLFEEIRGSQLEDILKSNISFVTFNYDRSLEQFFFNALKHTYNKDVKEVSEIMAKLKIIHVHGSMGELDWQNPSGRKYNSAVEYNDLINIRQQIKIIHETDKTDDPFSTARGTIMDSKRIIFLGYGFHSENLKRLGAPSYFSNKEIFMNYLGPEGDGAELIIKKLNKEHSSPGRRDSDVKWYPGDALTLFERFGSLIFS